jgi:hypothetical protein
MVGSRRISRILRRLHLPCTGRRSESTATMNRRRLIVLLGGTVIWLPFVVCAQPAMAQVKCDLLPVGPARTDCYIGLSRIHRQEVEISAGVAQQIKDSSRYRRVTGQRRNVKQAKRKSLN